METIKTYGPNLKTFFYHKTMPKDLENLKGIVLVLHGLEGHGARYEHLGDKLAENGYGMYAIDHISHGLTAGDDKQLGDWYPGDFEKCAYNAYFLAKEIRSKFPTKKLFLLGHDFGGYFAQYMLDTYTDGITFDGVALSGCGKNNLKQYSLFLRSITKKKIFHDRFKSHDIFRKRIASYNKPFAPNRTTYDWMNSDEDEVDKYIIDPKSGFVGTIGYYHEYYSNVIKIPEKLKFSKVNKGTPLLFIGGENDVVISFSKDLKRLVEFYENIGFSSTKLNIYPGARHDIFFEKMKEQVINDFINWLDACSGFYNQEEDKIKIQSDILMLKVDNKL